MFLHLQQDPLAPAIKIAKSLGISPTTSTTAIDWLRKQGIFTNVHPDLKHSALGLELVDVILYPTSYDALQALELKVSQNAPSNFPHPYVLYHTRIYGAKEGMYFQFQIPVGSTARLKEFLKSLVELNLLTSFELMDRDPSIQASTSAKLDHWNRDLLRWEFDGIKWINSFGSSKALKEQRAKTKSKLSELDYVDILLLSELTFDARQKNKTIGEKVEAKIMSKTGTTYQFKSQDLSRRLTRLKSEFIQQFRLFVNWAYFDIYSPSLFFVEAPKKTIARIAGHLDSNSELFPFESRMTAIQNGFYWYLRAPSNAISFAAEFLWQTTANRALCFLDYRSSEIYTFWDEVFDPEQRAWKTDYEFMVEEPLSYIRSYIQKNNLDI